MLSDVELERRKAVCRVCPDFRTVGMSAFCARECHREDGKYCEPWAAQQYRKHLAADLPYCGPWKGLPMNESFPPLPEAPQDGVLIVSIGADRRQHLWNAVASVRRHRPDLGIHVVSDVPVDVPFTWVSPRDGHQSRYYKTQPHKLSPFPGVTMLMDDDAVMHRPLPPLADVLDGQDIAMATDPWWPTLAHACDDGARTGWCTKVEADMTLKSVPPDVPQYNSGVVLFRKSEEVCEMMDRWHLEWQHHQRVDQLALVRALHTTGTPVRLLPPEYNCRPEKNLAKVEPYVYHFCIKPRSGDYHKSHASPAQPHLLYKAFCEAVNNGICGRRHYELIGKLLRHKGPCRLLVWGCGADSELWRLLNAGGQTVFAEDDPAWAAKARDRGCHVVDVTYPSLRGKPADNVSLPPQLWGTWDVIFVDAPRGLVPDVPGRELPIAWTSEIRGQAIVVAHDYERPWERWCFDHYVSQPDAVFDGRGFNGQMAFWGVTPEITEAWLR